MKSQDWSSIKYFHDVITYVHGSHDSYLESLYIVKCCWKSLKGTGILKSIFGNPVCKILLDFMILHHSIKFNILIFQSSTDCKKFEQWFN